MFVVFVVDVCVVSVLIVCVYDVLFVVICRCVLIVFIGNIVVCSTAFASAFEVMCV